MPVMDLLALGTCGAHEASVKLVGTSLVVSVGGREREVVVDETWVTVTSPDLSFQLVFAALFASVGLMWLAVADEHGVASVAAVLAILASVPWAVWAVRRLRWAVMLGTRREFIVFRANRSQMKQWQRLEEHLATASAVTRAWRRETGLLDGLLQSLRLISDPSDERLRELWNDEKPVLSFSDWAPVRLRRAWAYVLLTGAAPLLTGLGVAPRFGLGGALLAAAVVTSLSSWVGHHFLLQLEASEGAIGTLRPMFPEAGEQTGR